MAQPRLIRTDQAKPGDLITGTGPSGNYPAPRRITSIGPAREHSTRMQAYWVAWDDGTRNCYYGDAQLWLGQRP